MTPSSDLSWKPWKKKIGAKRMGANVYTKPKDSEEGSMGRRLGQYRVGGGDVRRWRGGRLGLSCRPQILISVPHRQ